MTSFIGRLRAPHYVYRLYGDGGQLLYVGCTYHPRKRLMEHRRTQPWWVEVRGYTLSKYANAADALDAEWVAHQSERPLHSHGHNARVTIRALLDGAA